MNSVNLLVKIIQISRLTFRIIADKVFKISCYNTGYQPSAENTSTLPSSWCPFHLGLGRAIFKLKVLEFLFCSKRRLISPIINSTIGLFKLQLSDIRRIRESFCFTKIINYCQSNKHFSFIIQTRVQKQNFYHRNYVKMNLSLTMVGSG